MRDRGVDVVEMHQMLAETVALPEARTWILDHQINANEVGLDVMADVRAYLDSLSPWGSYQHADWGPERAGDPG